MESTLEELLRSLGPDMSYDELKWATRWVKGPLSVDSRSAVASLETLSGQLTSQAGLGASDLIDLESYINRLERKAGSTELACEILQVILSAISCPSRKWGLETGVSTPTIVSAELIPSTEPLLVGRPLTEAEKAEYEDFVFGPGITEEALVQDFVYVLQGIDGKYIQLSDERFISRMVPFAEHQVRTLRDMGVKYKKIVDRLGSISNPSVLFLTFKTALVKHLRDFIAMAGLVDSNVSQWTLLKLVTYMMIPGRKLDFLDSVSERVCREPQKALQVLFTIKSENFIFRSISDSLFSQVVSVWLELVAQWATRGRLPLKASDFFVREKPLVNEMRPAKLSSDKIDLETLWNETFELGPVPLFIDERIAKTIFETGKTAAYLRACGQSLLGAEEEGKLRFKSLADLKTDVETVFQDLNKSLLELIVNKNSLLKRLRDIHRFLLLAQGDFAETLLVLTRKELVKPAVVQNKYELQFQIDNALGQTCEHESLEGRLSVFLSIRGTNSDIGYDVFFLDYAVDDALQVILSPDRMGSYRKLFGFLWKLLRSQSAMKQVWLDLQPLGRKVHAFMILDGVSELVERANIVRSEIAWFLDVFRSLVCYEIIESAFKRLEKDLSECQSLDQLVFTHKEFLENLQRDLLLDTENILEQIHVIQNVAIRMGNAFPAIVAELSTAIATNEDVSEFRFTNIAALLDDFHDTYNDAYNSLMGFLSQEPEHQRVMERLTWHSD
jgi:hypothetical protein